MPSFMLELAVFPSEKFENLHNILSSNDTWYIHELRVNNFKLIGLSRKKSKINLNHVWFIA